MRIKSNQRISVPDSLASILLLAWASNCNCSAFVSLAPISRSCAPAFASGSVSVLVKATSFQSGTGNLPTETDVIVIGSGLAGLSAAALLSHCETSTVVLESHDTCGGAAHGWTRKGFHFESGPSLYSGFSMDRSPNPLANVFQIIGESPEWITYDRWGTVLPNGKKFAAKIGPDEFNDVLKEHGGPGAQEEFAALMKRMEPLSNAAQALTSMALREDAGAIFTLLRYPRELIDTLKQGQALNDPFKLIMDEMDIKNEFVKNWLDMLCFLLQGLPATGTMNAVMAYSELLLYYIMYELLLLLLLLILILLLLLILIMLLSLILIMLLLLILLLCDF